MYIFSILLHYLTICSYFRTSNSFYTPSNITQNEVSEYVIEDMDATPTHKADANVDAIKAEHDKVVDDLKADHEREMSELRKYFENVCQELEVKYRADTEESIPRSSATPAGCWNIAGGCY